MKGLKDKTGIKGMVTVSVIDKDGNIKRFEPSFFRRLLGLQGRQMVSRKHNIVTKEGDALIADALLSAPTRNKVVNGSGYIQVGTGWTGNSTKTNTRCNSPTGSMGALDANYPVINSAWGTTGDNVVTYRATFVPGTLNANGINEACLLNGNGNGAVCFAYAQIVPSVNVTTSDTLQVLWEIILLGQ